MLAKKAYPRSVTIFSSREDSNTLLTTLKKTIEASSLEQTTINIIVNGNSHLSSQMSNELKDINPNNSAINLWSIPLGDKANAWNAFIHHIYDQEEIAIFIDGYVKVRADAFDNLARALINDDHAFASSGAPPLNEKNNTQRNEMLRNGGIHGNLCAVKGGTLKTLQEINATLPLGIYRTDGTLGALLCFNLSPDNYAWDTTRIIVTPDASWNTNPKKTTTLHKVTSQLKRITRQGKGVIENRALHDLFSLQKSPINALPKDSYTLCRNWCLKHKLKTLIIALKNPLVTPYILSLMRNHQTLLVASKPQLIFRSTSHTPHLLKTPI